jgi:hemoglobin
MGGYDSVAAVIDELFTLIMADPRFARFAMGRSIDSHLRARQLLVEQICQLAGGPCVYIGRDMKTAHAGLGITENEWQINLEYTRKALSKHGIADSEQAEFIALFERYKQDIVESAVPGVTS